MPKKVTIALLREKECKHSVRFKSSQDVDAEGMPIALDNAYLSRAFVGNANAVKVTLEVE